MSFAQMEPGSGSSRAVGYLRRSTDRQEQSIGDQRKAIEAYAANHGLKVMRFYTDDAISGTSTINRHAFQQLISDAKRKSRDFDMVVVYDVKRFGRIDNDEAGYYRHILRTHGVEVRYVTENFTGDRTDDLLRPVKQWQAREESKDLSKVTIRGLLSKSTTGTWMGGVPPYGYDLRYESASGEFLMHVRYMPDGSKQIFDENWTFQRSVPRGQSMALSRKDCCRLVLSEEPRQKVIKDIFQMYTEQRRGLKAIADHLNRGGIQSPRALGWSGRCSGKWSVSTIRAILVNPAYMGDMAWNRRTDARFHRITEGKTIERDPFTHGRLDLNDQSDWIIVKDAHPPLVTRRVFELARTLREQEEASKLQIGINPRTGEPAKGHEPAGVAWVGPKAKYLLSGLMVCARCGNRYEGHTQYRKQLDAHGKRKRSFGYACGGYIRHGKSVCRIGRFAKEQLEETVVRAIIEFYDCYRGKHGLGRIKEALDQCAGGDAGQVQASMEECQKRLREIDRITRSLLDNITKANRHLVDQRIEELGREREKVEARIESTRHLVMSRTEREEVVRQVGRFVEAIESGLRQGALEERQLIVRQCIHRIEADHEAESLKLALRTLPLAAGLTQSNALETLDVKLATPEPSLS